eukprot:CAMPEP_0194073248 /NCGR_PEP_ID=MMETSP0149-20130528/748_1 /TAXON_ID=122233 /ORGANISM="Chaetoceros debilis, Strain MM31A-1" /LENGTH=510 /DNA_ID=CAMNT_0038753241 /DNA_START=71 /DNA_END=1603 /DNA_ORIENTATION=+
MKQFLHISGPATVVALNNYAYAVIQKNDEKVHLFELKAPPGSSGNGNGNGNANQNGTTQEKFNTAKQLSASKESQLNSVQAVVSKWDAEKNELLCAVSRYDKFVAVYAISLKDANDIDGDSDGDGGKASVQVEPIVTHKTPKRCCALAFGEISPMNIIIAGDLAGDVHAFPVEKSKSESNSNGNDSDNGNGGRLLLGHTASMLTSVQIVDGKLFSADRDEKVRISSFPQTFITDGYLLGHEAYVTDFTVLASNSNSSGRNGDSNAKYCVTASGDKTIKLWNYKSCVEVASLGTDTDADTSSEDGKDNKDSVTADGMNFTDEEEQQTDRKESSSSSDDDDHIPVRVSSDKKGELVAVVYNGKNTIDILTVKDEKFEKLQSLECQSSPLAAMFSDDGSLTVLSKESSYVERFAQEDGNVPGFFSNIDDCKITAAIKEVAKEEDISMPSSILEVDEVTGKLKVTKKLRVGSEGYVKHEPWMRGERVQTKKDKAKRRKKRKLEEKHGGLPTKTD